MNRVKQSERDTLVRYAKQRINLDGRGNVISDTDALQTEIVEQFDVSRERADRAIGLAILRARGEIIREREKRR